MPFIVDAKIKRRELVRPTCFAYSWNSTTPTPTPTRTSSQGSSRENVGVSGDFPVQLATGITSGNRACRTWRRGSSRGCSCRCRRRGVRAYRPHFTTPSPTPTSSRGFSPTRPTRLRPRRGGVDVGVVECGLMPTCF